MVFPQLLLVLYLEKANTYGSVFSYFFGLIFRLLCELLDCPNLKTNYSATGFNSQASKFPNCLRMPFVGALIASSAGGDVLLNIPATITFGSFPNSDPCGDPGPAPFRTIVMLISIAIHVGISLSTDYLFTNGHLPLQHDFFHCFEITLVLQRSVTELPFSELRYILTLSGMVVSSNRVARGFLRPRKSHSMSWRKRATSCPGQASKTEVEDPHHESKAIPIAILSKTYLNTLTCPMSEMHNRRPRENTIYMYIEGDKVSVRVHVSTSLTIVSWAPTSKASPNMAPTR